MNGWMKWIYSLYRFPSPSPSLPPHCIADSSLRTQSVCVVCTHRHGGALVTYSFGFSRPGRPVTDRQTCCFLAIYVFVLAISGGSWSWLWVASDGWMHCIYVLCGGVRRTGAGPLTGCSNGRSTCVVGTVVLVCALVPASTCAVRRTDANIRMDSHGWMA